MWPETLTSVMVLCSDMTIVWVGTVFDMDPESLPYKQEEWGTGRKKINYGLSSAKKENVGRERVNKIS